MNLFQKHMPTFVDCDRPLPTIEFETTDDLLKLEDVQKFKEMDKFSHFAISDNCLMAIFDDGFKWWVVGYIKEPSEVILPKWDGGKYRAILDGKEVILSKEVGSSCGNTLTLKDGRKALNLRE